MADETTDTPDPAAEASPQPRLRLHSQFLQDMSFENPQGARSFSKADLKPQVQVNLNVDSRKLRDTYFEVALKISVNAELEGDPWFLVEMDYRGVFSLTGVDDSMLSRILLIEGPRTLFPFARHIIADAVRDGGFPPLLLEPVDFVSMYRQHAPDSDEESGAAEGATNGAG